MPGFDGTGPMRMGTMTGGGRDFCAIPVRPVWPVYTGMRFSMPYVVPWGIHYGGANPFTPEIAREEELDFLKGLVQFMRENLKEIEERIRQIENTKD